MNFESNFEVKSGYLGFDSFGLTERRTFCNDIIIIYLFDCSFNFREWTKECERVKGTKQTPSLKRTLWRQFGMKYLLLGLILLPVVGRDNFLMPKVYYIQLVLVANV